MANPALTESVEEDASVLQFPKEEDDEDDEDEDLPKQTIKILGPECYICRASLEEPYIRCQDCPFVELCLNCFANGEELSPHENFHSYIFIHKEMSLFGDNTWKAKDELNLLEAIEKCGYGNWEDISGMVGSHTAKECCDHYNDLYIDNPAYDGLPIFEKPANISRKLSFMKFKYTELDEPPRYSPGTPSFNALGGYNAPRGDFEYEFDNNAENILSDVILNDFQHDDEDYELGSTLQACVVEAYNNRLKERARRKKIIKNHGLIVLRKTLSWFHRYDSTLTKRRMDTLIPFMKLVSAHQFAFIMEGLHYAYSLKRYIRSLQDLRENGITSLTSSQIFYKLKHQREKLFKDRKAFYNSSNFNVKLTESADGSSSLELTTSNRKTAPPLEIAGLPKYENLLPNERTLCSTVRIVPESYLLFKNILINEYRKCGFLRLAQARKLIKIDVNKTRKVYDFLIDNGYITADITNK